MSLKEPLVFKSISAMMQRLEQPLPMHPMVALLNYGDKMVKLTDAGEKFLLDFYKISFKTGYRGKVKYGQEYYDFEEGGLAFLAPNQLITMSAEEDVYEGYALFFHRDIIRSYQLGRNVHKYGFFSYAVNEALYLSDQEKRIIAGLFQSIAAELRNNIDDFSQDVIVSQIELLLNYSNRFYNRQFITRKAVYNQLIGQLDLYLLARFDWQSARQFKLPTVEEIARHLKVSPRYLSDLLKSLTGQSTQQYVHYKLIERAKDILSNTNLTVAQIAYELGFEHPQSFSKIFKRKTNLSPNQFRQNFN